MRRVLLTLVVSAASTAMLWADPPAQVGRLSFVNGPVNFSSAAGENWKPATLNYPLTKGNMLSTVHDAKAEVEIGAAAVRLASDTGIAFEALDYQAVAIRLDKGQISISLRRLGQGQGIRVDTQTASVSLKAPGGYRVDQAESGDVTVTTRDGEAKVTGGQVAFGVWPGQTALIPASNPAGYKISNALAPDAWDQWVSVRDSKENGLTSTQYVSSEMDGVEDLDESGTWQIVAGYGPVWFPSAVPIGWAPYTLGQWVWIAPWGWTWVDDEPWGFAPFHYGRWVLCAGVWGWVPGPVVEWPIFAPALVRWVGGKPAIGFPPSQTGISWVSLGPGQVFRPWYSASTSYIRAVNVGGGYSFYSRQSGYSGGFAPWFGDGGYGHSFYGGRFLGGGSTWFESGEFRR